MRQMRASQQQGASTEEPVAVEVTRYGSLPKAVRAFLLFAFGGGIGVAVYYTFGFVIGGKVLFDVAYYYLLVGIFLPCVFILMPARKKDKRLPWYDLVQAALALGIGLYLFSKAFEIVNVGWIPPSGLNFAIAFILFLLVLEGGRRAGGFVYLAVCAFFGLYALFASHMPGILWGVSYSFVTTIGFNIFSSEALIGIPLKVVAEILIGFLVFAGILIASGGGKFFLNTALALLGRFRGGPAKVAVVSSAFFGSLSGSVFANIVATGSITIPAMKRTGYPKHYAAAIEACSSTGGVLMPPVMGAVAFVMAMLLAIDYAVVIIAAAIPAILYYFGLLMQVDAYAAKVGLRGLPQEEIPSLKRTLIEGWPFIVVLLFLVWGLLYMRWERLAPYYASGLLVLLSFTRRETMLTPRRIIETLATIGKLITQTMAIMLPIGLITGGLTITGTAPAFTAAIINLGAENIFLILVLGVVTCYFLGMAGLLTAAYIFLAVTLAPAIIQAGGLNVLAVHLFIIYYAMLAVITPPVASGAFIAAGIAGASPMKTAFQAMRLGVVIYFIPFFFIFNPSLILQGPIFETLYLFFLCLLGILLIAAGMEGYLVTVGKIGLWARPLLVVAGFLIAFPGWNTTIIGAALALFVAPIIRIRRKIKGWNTMP